MIIYDLADALELRTVTEQPAGSRFFDHPGVQVTW